HNRAKEALDICEPLWLDLNGLEQVVDVCMEMLFKGEHKPDPAQIDRVSRWMDQARTQVQDQRLKIMLLVGLGNIREQQELYQQAEDLYANAAKLGEDNGGAASTLVLSANAHNNLAWLMALEGNNWGEALKHADRALELAGLQAEFRLQAEILD